MTKFFLFENQILVFLRGFFAKKFVSKLARMRKILVYLHYKVEHKVKQVKLKVK